MAAPAIFVHDGIAIDYTPGADVVAGDVVVQGELVGVAKLDIKANKLGALTVGGVFDFPKATTGGSAITAGANTYWDNTTKLATTSTGGGTNKLIGKCVKAAVDADATVRQRMLQ